MFINNNKYILFAFFILMLSLASSAFGQFYFGKNKIQYIDFDWQVMTTEHFNIYFYTEEAEIAAIAAKSAEDSYRFLAVKFNHEVLKKIPLIIYSSPSYFSQTNIVPGILPEGVAGFTEHMKGRVVVPFDGSYYDFDVVIRHELVHVFTLSKLKAVTKRRTRMEYSYPPLWFTEGLAVFWSQPWNSQADMIVKDLVLSGNMYPANKLYQLNGSYFLYKLGESLCHFIDSTYGPDKLIQIFENWDKGKYFDQVLELTIGDNLVKLSSKWEYYLKKKYFPEIDTLGFSDMESKQITPDGYNIKAVPVKWDFGDGEKDWIVYKANRMGYSGIYMKPLNKSNKGIRTLIKGDRSADFESLYLLQSGIDVHPTGKIVFSSKSKKNDVIYIYDLTEKRVTDRFEFQELVATRSPRFSNDGEQVVFTGVRSSGFSDIFILNLYDGSYRAITDDIYYDVNPVFSYDNKAVIFSSDRTSHGMNGGLNFFKLNLTSHELEQITYGNFIDRTPEPYENGIYFSSNRNGSFNIYNLDSDGIITQQSTYLSGAFDPRLSADGKTLTYSGFQKMRFHIYSMDIREKTRPTFMAEKSNFGKWQPRKISAKYRQTSIKYDTDYSFDIAQSAIGYDPVYGSIGGMQVAMSDVLGNHAFYFLLTNTAQTKDEFLESFNFGITYIHREKRLNWGVGAFHLYNEYFNDFDGFYFEREAGAISLFSYPISKFHRLDFTTLAKYSKRERIFGLNIREKFLMTNYFSWVFDNSLWEASGPIEGRRYNVSIGITSSISDMANWSRQFSADFRHYFRLGKHSAFANRLFVFKSDGSEPQRIYFGGSWSFRGYDRREFYNRNILFASNELRFPLIDNLLIGFPFGGLGFQAIRGVLLFDVGSAWDDDFDQFLGSYGAGFRVTLGYFMVLRFDFTRTTDFHTISKNTDFDFFFGWNF